MAYSEADLVTNITALESALARGERTVQFSDRSVTYASATELKERIDYFVGLLRQVQGGRSKQSFGYAAGKGF